MRASILSAALATGFLAVTAMEASAGPHDAEIETILTEAVTDWSALLSCSILDPDEHATIVRWWDEEVTDIAELLVEAGVADKDAGRFLATLATEQLMAPTNGDTATLIAFCNDAGDWRRRMALFMIAQPARDIELLIRP